MCNMNFYMTASKNINNFLWGWSYKIIIIHLVFYLTNNYYATVA